MMERPAPDGSIVTRDAIVDGLRALGLESADTVLVHSSLKSFGVVADGGADYYPANIELAKIDAYPFTSEERRLILGANIAALLGLEYV